MVRSLAFIGVFALSIIIGFMVKAQEVKNLEDGTNSNAEQTELVAELEALREEIAKAQNDDKLIERERLYQLLKSARSEPAGRYVADAVWKNWMASAPTSEIADLVSKAMERRRWYDYAGALEHLDEVVKRAPDYSEGWNQRAYILFLQEKFDASLDSLEKALALEPRHFAALSGKARILFHQGRHQLAQDALKVAVDIHPWIYERFLLDQIPTPGQEPAEGKVGTKL